MPFVTAEMAWARAAAGPRRKPWRARLLGAVVFAHFAQQDDCAGDGADIIPMPQRSGWCAGRWVGLAASSSAA